MLNVNNPTLSDNAENKFYDLALKLVDRTLSEAEIPTALDHLAKKKEFNVVAGNVRIQLEKQLWQGGIPNGYSLKLIMLKEPI